MVLTAWCVHGACCVVLPCCVHGAFMGSYGALMVIHSWYFHGTSMVLSCGVPWCLQGAFVGPYGASIMLPWYRHGAFNGYLGASVMQVIKTLSGFRHNIPSILLIQILRRYDAPHLNVRQRTAVCSCAPHVRRKI